MSAIGTQIEDADTALAQEWGTRVVDIGGDVWRKQGGTDSWKMLNTTGLRTTSARLVDLWGPLVVIGDITGQQELSLE